MIAWGITQVHNLFHNFYYFIILLVKFMTISNIEKINSKKKKSKLEAS